MTDQSHLPFSPAAERNQSAILEVIGPRLRSRQSVLEIGAGTGQHAVALARALPHLTWTASDVELSQSGLVDRLQASDLANLNAPLVLDVNQFDWLNHDVRYEAAFSANTLHIMAEPEIETLFAGLPNVLTLDATMIFYGPFKMQGAFIGPSNAAFDASLRARGVGSAIRDREWIESLADAQGFTLCDDVAMPANNQCLIFQRVA